MRLFQKILSHGLLIAFFVAVFFLYLYRVELFPQWFGEEAQRAALPSATGTVEPPSAQAPPPAEIRPPVQPEPAPETAVTEAAPELPAVAAETPVTGQPGEAEQQAAGLPPLAGADQQGDELPPMTEPAATADLPPLAEPSPAAELPPMAEPASPDELPPAAETVPAAKVAPVAEEPSVAPAAPLEQPAVVEPAAQPAIPPQVLPPQPVAQPEGTAQAEPGVTWAPPAAGQAPQPGAGEMPQPPRPQQEPAVSWGAEPGRPSSGGYRPVPPTGSAPDAGAPAQHWQGATPPAAQAPAPVAQPQYRPEPQRRSYTPSQPWGAQQAVAPAAGAMPQDTAAVQPSDYQQRLAAARTKFWQRDVGAAMQAYEDLTAAYPDSAEAWGELGNVSFKLGHWAQAAEAYYQAVSLLIQRGEAERARHLLRVLHGLDADKANELEARIRHAGG